MNRLLAFFLFIGTFLLSPSCSRYETEELHVIKEIDYNGLVKVLNQNVQSVRQLVDLKKDNKQLFSVSSTEEKTQLFFLEEEQPVTLYKIVTPTPVLYPCLSVASEDDDYYWTLSGELLTDTKGERISVTDKETIPSIQYRNDQWICTLGDSSIVLGSTMLSYGYPIVERMDEENAYISFPNQFQLSFTMTSFSLPLVPNKVFYKDVFLDAGIGLTSRKSLSAANILKLSLEGISFSRYMPFSEEYEQQNEILAGCSYDTNGRLLYPDGQPRYKVLFVNGGKATEHGESLDEMALGNMRQFYCNGGSYVGTCAGAFFAAKGSGNNDYSCYLSIWPYRLKHTGITNSSSGMFIEANSPLLNYFDFGGDYYIEDIRHNGGCYLGEMPIGTEILARYDYPSSNKVHMQPSAWAYKGGAQFGRIILEGSHPEEASSGEKRDFTSSMILYAIDGLGNTTLKGFLQNGKVRQMNKSTEDDDPSFTKIGDKQCHHFVVYIPGNASNIKVRVDSEKECDLALRLKKNTFAFPDNADYKAVTGGPIQQLEFDSLEDGLWYISVQCLTTVEVEQVEYGQLYKGRTDVLNGVPYSIGIFWE